MTQYDSAKETLYHIRRVSAILHKACKELLNRADNHDKSKLRYPEKAVFDKYTPKLKDATYGSDEYNEFLSDMKPALEDHYAANFHHPEHYENGIDGMNLLDLVEMYCDWRAASERHDDGDLDKSITLNKDRFEMSDQLTDIFRNTMKVL